VNCKAVLARKDASQGGRRAKKKARELGIASYVTSFLGIGIVVAAVIIFLLIQVSLR